MENNFKPRSNTKLDLILSSLSNIRSAGVTHLSISDKILDGRSITINGKTLINFGSCSYLGLEVDERLKHGAIEAIHNHGTQFSSSRAYVSSGLYGDLEELMSQIVGTTHIVIAPTTTLAHASALPVLVDDNDGVIYDAQVHSSVQINLSEMMVRGVVCESVHHNDMNALEQQIQILSHKHERIFYLCDGVYSMCGDLLDVDSVYRLLDLYTKLHVYVDDAHGTGWSGKNGAGTVLGNRHIHPRMVVVLGLAKSFGSAGSVIVAPNEDIATQIRLCGRTLIFSGPIQPAQLGANIASARIHLSDEITSLQNNLLERINVFNNGLPQFSSPSPIKFVTIGKTDAATQAILKLMDDGFYTNIACYPAVARGKAGIRIVLNNNQTIDDVENLVKAIRTL